MDLLDHDGQLGRRLARLRHTVAGRLAGDPADRDDLDALRAALAATFERVDAVMVPDLDGTPQPFLLPYIRQESLDVAAWAHDMTAVPQPKPIEFRRKEKTAGRLSSPGRSLPI